MAGGLPQQVYDERRLAAVRATGLLDTGAEEDFDRLTRLATVLLEAPFAFVTLVDETRSFWKSCFGVDAVTLEERQNPVQESFCQYVVATEKPLVVGDAANDPRTAGNPSIALLGVAAWAGFPVRGPAGDVLGSFCVVDRVVREWTDRDLLVLETLAAAAGGEVALRTAMATAAAANAAVRASQERLEFIADVADVLATTTNAEDALAAFAHRIVPFLGDWCLITVLDDTSGELRDLGRAHSEPGRLAAVHRYADVHRMTDLAPIPTAMRTGRPMIIESIDAELIGRSLDPPGRAALAELAPAAAAVFPLRGRGEPFGAIALYNGRARGPHTEAELAAAQETAQRAGLLLDNARLHTRQIRLAEVLQRSLLTPPPQVPGLAIAVRYHPAAQGSRVGGDWYDAYSQPDGSVVLVIGDVVGHDVAAVGLMGQIRSMTRSIGYDRGATPAEVLRRVDAAIRGLGVEALCTMLVVRLSPETGPAPGTGPGTETGPAPGRAFTWSSAGHPAPLLVQADGREIALSAEPELLLGVRPDADRSDHEAVLPPGATLLLMTDGLFERRDLSFREALDRLRAHVVELAGRPIDELCDRLLGTADIDAGDDDVALIAVRPDR